MFLALSVMMLLAETPQVTKWFVASAILAGLAYATAVVAAYLEP